jgi:hypothetical protein
MFIVFGFTYIRQLNLPQIQRILQEFEKQSEIMDMKEEMMNDAIDDAMEDEGDEEERYLLYFPSEFVFVLYVFASLFCISTVRMIS